MRCLNCRYNLRALSVNRCQECDRAFDPRNPDTFRSSCFRLSDDAQLALVVVAIFVFIALSVVAVMAYAFWSGIDC